MPSANSQYVFTPPVPTATSGSLSFTGVSQTAMTLNWTNWASNEIGYVIYNSTDNINFDFVRQTAANATSSAFTGLLPSTTYYWRLYAVTEGCLSAAISGSRTTSAAGNKVSNQSGNWNVPGIWTPIGVPSAGDNVTIANSHVVSINTTAQCNNLTVGQGAACTLRFNTGTARSLTVNNDILVNTNAIFNVNTSSDVTHALIADGNIINNGNINFATDGNSLVNTLLSKNGNQTLSGTGSNNFNNIEVNLGTPTDIMEITASNFAAPTDFLTLTSGVFKVSTLNSVNITPFALTTTLSIDNGLWLNSPNLVVNTSAGLVLKSNLTISNGTLNVGSAADQDLEMVGGVVLMSNGALNVAGKLDGSDINNTSSFNLSGGNVTVPTVGSTNTSIAPFHISGAGSECNVTGGRIIIRREGGNGAQDLGFYNTNSGSAVVTGGTLQIGDASTPAGQTMNVNTDVTIHNLHVNSANAIARLNTNSLSIANNVTISSGTLNANNLNISLGGNWSSAGSFTPGTGSVTFNSNSAQSIFRSGGETFNQLNFAGTGVKTFSAPITTSSHFSIASTASVNVGVSTNTLTVRGNFMNNGNFNAQTGLVWMNGNAAQTIGGTSTTDFYNLTLTNNAGLNLTNAENLLGTLTLNGGNFNVNSQVFTMVSNASGTARIAQITGTGDITGNVRVQRYMPGGATGWALIGNPISSALSFNDWADDIIITCAACPYGTPNGFTSVYSYSEAVTGLYDAPASYVAINSNSDAILAGKGYWVYLGNNTYTTVPLTLEVTGTVRKNNYTIPLSRTNTGSSADDGWNLIHNPYPSPISWTALRAATANIDNAIYVYNADLNSGAGGFATYINGISSPVVASGGVDDNIPMFQGFYVHSTGATALNAVESNKVAGNPTFLRPSSTQSMPVLRIHLQAAGSSVDEVVLYTDANATNAFDDAFDAYKMRGQDPNAPYMALENGSAAFQVNGITPIAGTYSTSLKALTGSTGNYVISADDLSSFPQGACINLYDRFTSISTDLRNSNYSFNLSDTTTVARFVLNITMDNTLTVVSSVQQPNCSDPNSGRIKASVSSGGGPWNYYWKNNGVTVQTVMNRFGADSLLNQASGTIDLEVNTVGACDYEQTNFNIIPQQPTMASFTYAAFLSSGIPVSVQFVNGSQNASNYYWDFGTGQDFSNASSPDFVYTSAGVYSVSLIATSATGCKDTTQVTLSLMGQVTGINSPGLSNGFLVKTLPDNVFVLEFKNKLATDYRTEITDLSGKVILTYDSGDWQSHALTMDLNPYTPGLYFVNLTSATEKIVVKIPVK